MTLSVIGAGLGRTGTLSLKLALERLGFGPCYHTRELLKQLDAHVAVWNRAADGDFVDWDALYEGYSSAVDFPTAAFYRELSGHYLIQLPKSFSRCAIPLVGMKASKRRSFGP